MTKSVLLNCDLGPPALLPRNECVAIAFACTDSHCSAKAAKEQQILMVVGDGGGGRAPAERAC